MLRGQRNDMRNSCGIAVPTPIAPIGTPQLRQQNKKNTAVRRNNEHYRSHVARSAQRYAQTPTALLLLPGVLQSAGKSCDDDDGVCGAR